MATTSPPRHDRTAPEVNHVSLAVDGHGSDNGRHPSVWPVADTPGRPFIHPHRLAQAMGDRHAVYEDACRKVAERHDDLPEQISDVVIWLGGLVLVIGLVLTVF